MCWRGRGTKSGRAGKGPARRTNDPRAKELFDPAKITSLPRPLCWRRFAAARSAALGFGELCQRPEPCGGTHQQSDDRDSVQVRGLPAGESERKERRTLIGRKWRVLRDWLMTCGTTADGCATRPRSASGISTRRSRSRLKWRRTRPDLKPSIGKKLTVIAWLWARTVESPNPPIAKVARALSRHFHALHKEWQGGLCRTGHRKTIDTDSR